jgi:hypothetical protein
MAFVETDAPHLSGTCNDVARSKDDFLWEFERLSGQIGIRKSRGKRCARGWPPASPVQSFRPCIVVERAIANFFTQMRCASHPLPSNA